MATTNMEYYRDKEVTCSDCGRSYVCTPVDDVYECKDGLHRCMDCLMVFSGMPLGTKVVAIDADDAIVDVTVSDLGELEIPGE
jgi:hypothetical protein